MKAVQYTSVFIKPKYNTMYYNLTILKAVGVFLSFYIPAYIYIYIYICISGPGHLGCRICKGHLRCYLILC